MTPIADWAAEGLTDRRAAGFAQVARYDSMTGLPNRVRLKEFLQLAQERADVEGGGFALALLGLDGFRAINDSYGQEAGDDLLTLAADRLRDALPESDVLARLAGDEFALLLEAPDRVQALLRVQDLLDRMRQPFPLNGRSYHLSASAGLAWHPQDGDGGLLRNADLALTEAKAHARGQVRPFDPVLAEAIAASGRLENDLRTALQRGEMQVWHQPQISLATGAVAGVEALLRWRHGVDGWIDPARFVPLAEKAQLIIALGDWVLREACALVRALADAGLRLPRVAVNVSAVQLGQEDFARRVEAAIAETGCPARSLEIEVTESALMADVAASAAHMARLRELGVRVAIDDFGAGYSSLAQLHRLPLDCLKIDRAFVTALPDDADARAILRAILALGHALGLEVLAEGVENEAQAAFLRREGCDTLQGYLSGPPMPAAELAVWLAARS